MKKNKVFGLILMGFGAIQLGLSIRFTQVWWLSPWETMMGILFGLISLVLIGIGARLLFGNSSR